MEFRENDVAEEQQTDWASMADLNLLFNLKQPKTFHSERWQTGTNSDLCFLTKDDRWLTMMASRRVLAPFTKSQDCFTVIIPRHEVEGGYRFRCRPSVRHSVCLSRNRFRSITQKLFHISKQNLSLMEYCSPLWAGSPASHLAQLDAVETKAFKIIGISRNETEIVALSPSHRRQVRWSLYLLLPHL